MIKIKSALVSFIALMFFFVAIFCPPIGISNLLALSLTAMLFITCIVVFITKIRLDTRLIMPFLGFSPFLVYALLSVAFHILFHPENISVQLYLTNLWRLVIACVGITSASIILLSMECWSKFLNAEKVENLLIAVGMIQFLFVLLALFVPSVHQTFLTLASRYAKSEVTSMNFRLLGARSYSFSLYFGDIFSYVTSYISTITLLKAFAEKKVRYAYMALGTLIIHFLNARTGIVLFAFSFIVICVYYYRFPTWNDLIQQILGVLLIILVGFIAFLNLPDFNQQEVIDGIFETTDLASGDTESGTYSQILGEDVVIPKNLLFGIGCQPEDAGFYAKDGSAIDSGYIQLLWRFGLIGFLLLIFGYAVFFGTIYTGTNSKKLKCLCAIFAGTVALYYFKTYPLNLNGANFVLFAYTLMCYCHELRRKEHAVFPWEYQQSVSRHLVLIGKR